MITYVFLIGWRSGIPKSKSCFLYLAATSAPLPSGTTAPREQKETTGTRRGLGGILHGPEKSWGALGISPYATFTLLQHASSQGIGRYTDTCVIANYISLGFVRCCLPSAVRTRVTSHLTCLNMRHTNEIDKYNEVQTNKRTNQTHLCRNACAHCD